MNITPGTWLVNGSFVIADNGEGKKFNMKAVCEVYGDYIDQKVANRDLIAAAPDMLQALQSALPYVQQAYVGAFPDDEKNNEVIEKIKALINKATK